jgi:hypothetical protein
MRRLNWRYAHGLSGTVIAASLGGLLASALTRNLELAMLCSETFFASIAGLLVALAFTWVGRARRVQDRVDQLAGETARYSAARAVLDVEAERAASASEKRDQESVEALAAERAALQKEYADRLCEELSKRDATRAGDITKAWLLGFSTGQKGLTEDVRETSGVVIPWPVPQGDTAAGAGRYRN